MNNLLNVSDVAAITSRIDNLTAGSQRQWGKMTVAQMLAHCTAALRVANDETHPPRIFIGRILAPFIRKTFFDETPFPKNTPTDKSFIVTDQRDFDNEKKILKEQINKFCTGGEAGVTKHPHSFVGRLTPQQWSIGMYKHLDHHLRQFGV